MALEGGEKVKKTEIMTHAMKVAIIITLILKMKSFCPMVRNKELWSELETRQLSDKRDIQRYKEKDEDRGSKFR